MLASRGLVVHSVRAHLAESVYGLLHCRTFDRHVLEVAYIFAVLLDGGLSDLVFGQPRKGSGEVGLRGQGGLRQPRGQQAEFVDASLD